MVDKYEFMCPVVHKSIMAWSSHANFYEDVKADDNTHTHTHKAYEITNFFYNEALWTTEDQLLSNSKSDFRRDNCLGVRAWLENDGEVQNNLHKPGHGSIFC